MKIVCAQQNFIVGDFEYNYNKIKAVIQKHGHNSDLIVFSELCLSGYYPYDLLERKTFIKAQQAILDRLIELSKKYKAALILGAMSSSELKDNRLFNSLLVIHNGQLISQYHKQLLPNYHIFNEARHFQAGTQPGIIELFDKKIGLLICEDGWKDDRYKLDPVAELEKHQLDLIISINASPAYVGKQMARKEQFASISKRLNAPLIYVNQIGGQDEIIYDGASFLLDDLGHCLGQMNAYEEGVGLLEFDSELIPLEGWHTFKPLSNNEIFYRQICLGLKDYVYQCKIDKVIIALSGGIDSALTLVLAVSALGKHRVKALFLPSKYTSKISDHDANLLAQRLDIQLFNYSIQPEFDAALEQFAVQFNEPPHSLVIQNIQARIRGRIVMEYANQVGGLVVSTSNKSELSVGFTTLYGDLIGGLNLIGDLYKTEVYMLAHYYNQTHPNAQIPTSILERAPSPELADKQLDQDTLPPYEQLDAFLRLYIEGDLLNDKEYSYYQKIANQLSSDEISYLKKQVDISEFKRRQACPIIKLQRRAFGIGRQYPIAHRFREV